MTRVRWSSLVVLVTLAVLPAFVDAQAAVTAPAPTRPEDRTEGSGSFLFGLGLFDLSALDERLVAHGYDEISRPLSVIGGEGHAVFESGFVVGGHGAALLAPDGDGPGDVESSLSGGFGMLDLGFALVHTPAWLLTATGGVGGYGLSLELDEHRSVRFDDVLRNPERSASLSRGGVLVGATLGLDGRIPIGAPDRGRQPFCAIGLRVGGMYGPPLGDWSLDDGTRSAGGPDLGLLGGYVALAIGFGARPVATPTAPTR